MRLLGALRGRGWLRKVRKVMWFRCGAWRFSIWCFWICFPTAPERSMVFFAIDWGICEIVMLFSRWSQRQTVVAAISQLPVTRSWHDPLKIHRALLKTISKPNGIASTLMYKSIYDWHWLTIRFKRPNSIKQCQTSYSSHFCARAGRPWRPHVGRIQLVARWHWHLLP